MIYIVAVGFGVVRVIVDIGERRNLAGREFHYIAERASSSAVLFGFMSREYQETMRDALEASRVLLGAIISSSSGDFAFERFPGSSVAWVGNSPRFQTRIDFPGQPLFLPLRIDGQAHVNIQAIYSIINNAFLVRVLRDTLLAVLVALAVAFITLMAELIQKNRRGYQVPASPAALSETGPGPVSPQAAGESLPPVAKPDAAVTPPPVADEGEDTPQGLFTQRGNIGWQSYTNDRLASELHRCASFEQDLTFLVMEFKCAEAINDSLYHQFADEAVSFFVMRDLIFEMGEKGIAVIIPSVDLDQSMARAEEFRRQIASRLPESFEGRSKLFMGLSSRSGRLIEAERLVMEASTALKKTQEEPVSHIVAFKSDPEKYRNFVKMRL
ncbi:MAG: hypothetical protein FWC64_08050 [Treponema sp.]|nr:hypothetical protein [Treponema sp.]